jgi:membrane protease subunit HflK
MADHVHSHDELPQPDRGPNTPVDAGSQALSEALRSSFSIVKVAMALLVLLFLGSGFFTVGPQEEAIILRFGRPVGQGQSALLGSGFHWSFPYPIDDHIKVPIAGKQEVRSTVGWYAVTPEQELAGTEPPAGPSLNPAVDGYALTADNNIIHTRVTLTYRINDPIRYVFSFVNSSNAVQNALDNALIHAAAHYTVDDALYRDVLGFREAVLKRATEIIRDQDLGVVIEQCSVQSVPPRQLKEAFANVLRAEVNRSKVLNEARSYENQVLSKASADSASRTNLAESDRARLVNDVASRADQFQQLLPKYSENPSLFVQQRLTETLGRVFTNAQDKIFIAEAANGRPRQLRALINREPPKRPEAQKP